MVHCLAQNRCSPLEQNYSSYCPRRNPRCSSGNSEMNQLGHQNLGSHNSLRARILIIKGALKDDRGKDGHRPAPLRHSAHRTQEGLLPKRTYKRTDYLFLHCAHATMTGLTLRSISGLPFSKLLIKNLDFL